MKIIFKGENGSYEFFSFIEQKSINGIKIMKWG